MTGDGRTIRTRLRALSPSLDARRGAAIGALSIAVLTMAFWATQARSGFGTLIDALLGAAVALVGVGIIAAITMLVLTILRLLPRWLTGVLLGAVASVAFVFALPDPLDALLGVLFVALAALIGVIVYPIARGSLRGASSGRRVAAGAALVLVLSAGLAAAFWIASPGSFQPVTTTVLDTTEPVLSLDVPDPSMPGALDVRTMTYGSGDDPFRAEFAEAADITTTPVDGSAFVTWSGLLGRARAWRWGFDSNALPLNARVWLPEGDGPFPLVLVVHGNHNALDFSDPGYAYLGELLASRGFIVASVDENFLNGGVYGKASGENDARAWLLLQHLAAWRDWADDPNSPLQGLADMTRIGLVGHSRGGEAAATAAALNRLERHPDNARRAFDFGFGIRSVVAIAPSDGQYTPGGSPTELTNVSYLVLGGGHDADVSTFRGMRQFQRVSFSEDAEAGTEADPRVRPFKAALYVDRANHGQFNTTWGRRDRSAPAGWLLNTAPLMPAEEQQRVAKVAIAAFLEATLRDTAGYLSLFRDHRTGVQSDWMPDAVYVSRYADGGYRPLSTFEEDVDAATSTVAGGAVEGRNLAVWREKTLKFRNGKSQGNRALYLGWKGDSAHYGVDMPAGTAHSWAVEPDDRLVLAVAQADQDPPGLGGADTAGDDTPLDLTVVLVDRAGRRAALPLGEYGVVPRPIRSRFTKWDLWEQERYRKDTEPILQSFEIPLSHFVGATPGLDLSRLARVELRFDRSPAGVIIVDDIGFDTTP